jgi:hypothetical protein
MKKIIIFLISILMFCSSPTAPRKNNTTLGLVEVKLYYNLQTSSSDMRAVHVKDGTDSACFKKIAHFSSSIRLDTITSDSMFMSVGDTLRTRVKANKDTLISYYISSYGYMDGGDDTLVVTKDTTWILN